MRLAPEPPALLARLEPDEADALVVALRKAGLAVLAIPAAVPTDRDRVVVRGFSIDDGAGVGFTSRSGDSLQMPWPDVLAILRGLRASRTEVERTEKSRTFSAGMALATSGLMMTRTSTRTVRTSDESSEQVILVYSRGGRAALLAERQLDFACLGAAMSALPAPPTWSRWRDACARMRRRRSTTNDSSVSGEGRCRSSPAASRGPSRGRRPSREPTPPARSTCLPRSCGARSQTECCTPSPRTVGRLLVPGLLRKPVSAFSNPSGCAGLVSGTSLSTP